MSAIATALRGKASRGGLGGPIRLLRRAEVIGERYGFTPARMERALDRFVDVLGESGCGATFPVTTAALLRHPGVLERYRARDIEFAVHGYYHVDHAQLPLDVQLAHLADSRRSHLERGDRAAGFRAPYLRFSAETIAAVRAAGFLYDSSQALAWDVVGDFETPAYRHVLGFYDALSAADYPALPRLEGGLVRIPYCLPDDEALVDRLETSSGGAMSDIWLAILDRTYELGELFTLGLHPERIRLCERGLAGTLRRARAKSPAVWIARLDEIARWWLGRAAATVTIATCAEGEYRLEVMGPAGVTILARGVEPITPAITWAEGWWRMAGASARFRAQRRPFIGISRRSTALGAFLHEQGYIVEEAADDRDHAFYFDRPIFRQEEERTVLAEIDGSAHPLVTLGRWPNGARSALCVTGDLDAFTVGDYALRLVGR